ncbi:MAG: hypothetical protein J6S72_03020 [Lachnospiraceae bacterium]|nr:hypothetical protein [Lachnospiraceae bacterium]MBO7633336.1 hypothetical protein [Lachnospiraceae bacterium]MBP5653668.1 hypothetical protein [Lachnospiraceae bacterium]
MATINVYEQYFKAQGTFNGVKRKAALVMLVSDSEAGQIRYTAGVTFFPHKNDEDFAVSYDAFFEKVLYEGKGRRSKKKEQAFLDSFRETVDAVAAEAGGKVLWDEPLREARRG